MSRLRIAETFTSIQGEGRWLGVPSYFIRISGCNLRCRWCDTPYASWNPEGPTLDVEEILAGAQEAGASHVVVTGGEPMLFEPVIALTQGLKSQGRCITIETAGTVFREVECDLMSISPKLAHSAPGPDEPAWRARHEETRKDLSPCRRLMEAYPHQLKFVVDPAKGMEDVDEIMEILQNLPKTDPSNIFLMAEGVSAAVLHEKERMLVDICIEKGWRLAPRFHIDLFGDKRGT